MEVKIEHSAERKKIVPQLLPREKLKAECFHVTDLVDQLGRGDRTGMKVLEWLAARKLIRNEFECLVCKVPMLLTHHSAEGDEYVWCCKICSSTKSVREDSVFTASELSLWKLIYFFNFWVHGCNLRFCAFESGITTNPEQTASYLASVCLEICEQWLEENPSVIGGITKDGLHKVVVIGESEYFYRKYNLGLWKEGHWVFGGVEKETGKCFFVEVPDRTEATLTNLIQKFILPGTIIVSDGWATYANIPAIEGGNYEHSIQKSMQENIWIWAKRKIRQRHGISQQMLPLYLHELFWRDAFKDLNLFPIFLTCIGSISNWN